jgi:putative ABC transport system permease protein
MTKLVWRNLIRNKLRTFLTLASVALALFILSLLSSLLEAMERAEGSVDNRVVVRNKISLTFSMPESYWQKLKQLDHVQAVTPLNWYGGRYKDDRPENFFPRFAADPDTMITVFTDTQLSAEHLEAWKADRAGFIAGKALVDKYGWKLGDRVQIEGDIWPVNLDITLRGIFEQPNARSNERQVFFQREYLLEALRGSARAGQIGTYWLLLDSPDNVPTVVKAAEALFENSEAPVRAETEEAFALSFLEMMGNVRLLLGSIGLAIVISILFITANTMAMAARDRTREVAVLRTLGFQRGQVTTMVLLESLIVGMVGAISGVLATASFLAVARKGLEESFAIFGTLRPTENTWMMALGIGLLIGLASGIVPALGAARAKIVDGLRSVA